MLQVEGMVTYRERIALPPDSVVIVTMIDASRADAPATEIASRQVDTAGQQVPLPFVLGIDTDGLDARGRYTVRAVIRGGDDRLLWTTDTAYPVDIAAGAVDLGTLTLVRVGGAAVPETGPLNLLTGREWVIDDIDGGGVIDTARTTVIFGEDGTVSGNAGCNSFSGSYQLDHGALRVGPLAVTRKMCFPALMDQEGKFLAILEAAGSIAYLRTEDGMTITSADGRMMTAH